VQINSFHKQNVSDSTTTNADGTTTRSRDEQTTEHNAATGELDTTEDHSSWYNGETDPNYSFSTTNSATPDAGFADAEASHEPSVINGNFPVPMQVLAANGQSGAASAVSSGTDRLGDAVDGASHWASGRQALLERLDTLLN